MEYRAIRGASGCCAYAAGTDTIDGTLSPAEKGEIAAAIARLDDGQGVPYSVLKAKLQAKLKSSGRMEVTFDPRAGEQLEEQLSYLVEHNAIAAAVHLEERCTSFIETWNPSGDLISV